MGCYQEADPLGIEEGSNHLYVYVSNNAISYVDWTGLVLANPNNINCIGYASGVGYTISPDPWKEESMRDVIESQGFKCTKTAAKCECDCNSDKMIVYIYTYKTNPKNKDPWNAPWIYGEGNDVHGIRSTDGCKGLWTYVPANLPKSNPDAYPRLTPNPNDPDSFWDGKVPAERYCCCREKRK